MLNNALQQSQAQALAADFNAATLTIYSGSVPADADAALSGNTDLATHTGIDLANVANGVITADPIADDTIDNSGTATFARLVQGTKAIQLTVGTSNAQLIVDNTTFVQNGTSKVTALRLTQRKVPA